MRYPKGHKDRSHREILDAAGKVFRQRGYSGGGVGVVMGEAGKTKGGFYAHFDSKQDLLAQVLDTALEENFSMLTQGLDNKRDREWIEAVVQRYLSDEHYQQVDAGCPLPCLLSEVSRAGVAPREAFEQYVHRMVDRLQQHLPGQLVERRQQVSLAVLAMLVGGMTVARAVEDERLASRTLAACRAVLLENLYGSEDAPDQDA